MFSITSELKDEQKRCKRVSSLHELNHQLKRIGYVHTYTMHVLIMHICTSIEQDDRAGMKTTSRYPSYVFPSGHRLHDRCRDVYFYSHHPCSIILLVYFLALPSLLHSTIYLITRFVSFFLMMMNQGGRPCILHNCL